MRLGIQRLALLLAASGLSDKEIVQLLRSAEKYGPGPILEQVRSIRAAVGELDAISPKEKELAADSRISTEADVVVRIEELLRKEAGMPASAAAAAMERALVSEGLRSKSLPRFDSKRGLWRWLGRIAAVVPPAKLLHIATRIRNEAVHRPDGDWPLRKRSR